MDSKLQQKIINLIADQLGLPVQDIKEDSHFVDDLGADSLDIVELIMAMEEEFDLEIPDEEAEKLLTLNDVLTYLKDHLD